MTSPYLLIPPRTLSRAKADLALARLNQRNIVSQTLASATERAIQDLRRKIRAAIAKARNLED